MLLLAGEEKNLAAGSNFPRNLRFLWNSMHSLVAVGVPGFIFSFRSGFNVRMRMPRFDLLLKGFGGLGEYHLSLCCVSAGGVASSVFRCCHPSLLFPHLYVIFLY